MTKLINYFSLRVLLSRCLVVIVVGLLSSNGEKERELFYTRITHVTATHMYKTVHAFGYKQVQCVICL